jgi:hypothetical protein
MPMIESFRQLYFNLIEYRGLAIYGDLLEPSINDCRARLEECGRFREPIPLDRSDDAAVFAMWDLYALNRVNDFLLKPFFPGQTGVEAGRRVTLDEYESFFLRIGMTIVRRDEFSPYWHEIVRVVRPSPQETPITLCDEPWPAMTFGRLLFSRAGAVVAGDRDHIEHDIAEHSTLYWTFQRPHRKVADLSHGWGSNSQWRTNIRRDYEIEGRRIYNFDGTFLLDGSPLPEDREDSLTHEERVELVRHRSMVLCAKPSDDLFPYDYRYEEVTPGG